MRRQLGFIPQDTGDREERLAEEGNPCLARNFAERRFDLNGTQRAKHKLASDLDVSHIDPDAAHRMGYYGALKALL
jgi:hypothetical protein